MTNTFEILSEEPFKPLLYIMKAEKNNDLLFEHKVPQSEHNTFMLVHCHSHNRKRKLLV